jgi:hypothetical protein
MFDITKYFTKGLKTSIQMKDNGSFSHNGPWKQVYTDTQIARWHSGEFSSAEFTISVDFSTTQKEIIKCIVCNSTDYASLVVIGRSNLGTNLVELSASVNSSYVDLSISPADALYEGAKFIYTAQYFRNQNPVTP